MKTIEEIMNQLEASELALDLINHAGGGESDLGFHGSGYVDALRWVLGLKDLEKDLNSGQ